MAVEGIIGIKLGMTQIFAEDGNLVGCTVLQAGPCVVVQMRTKQKRLAVLHIDVRFGDLRFSGTHALDLPSHEGDSRLEALFDEIIETRLAIDGDRRQRVLGLHRGSVYRFTAVRARALFLVRECRGGTVSAKYLRQAPRFASRRTQRHGDFHRQTDVRFGQ